MTMSNETERGSSHTDTHTVCLILILTRVYSNGNVK